MIPLCYSPWQGWAVINFIYERWATKPFLVFRLGHNFFWEAFDFPFSPTQQILYDQSLITIGFPWQEWFANTESAKWNNWLRLQFPSSLKCFFLVSILCRYLFWSVSCFFLHFIFNKNNWYEILYDWTVHNLYKLLPPIYPPLIYDKLSCVANKIFCKHASSCVF